MFARLLHISVNHPPAVPRRTGAGHQAVATIDKLTTISGAVLPSGLRNGGRQRDESKDSTQKKGKRNPAVRIVSLSRNFGKDIARSAGLDHANGSAVISIDAELQDPPELMSELFAKWLYGHDVVYATRTSRENDTIAKRLTASWFYQIHDKLAASHLCVGLLLA